MLSEKYFLIVIKVFPGTRLLVGNEVMGEDTRHLETLTKAELIAEVQHLRSCHSSNVEQNPNSQTNFSDANKMDRYDTLEEL